MTFGNDPAKLDRYRAFWSRAGASRPLTGFTLAGWFPMQEFAACLPWQAHRYLEPAMISPADFFDDHLRMLREGETMDDDLIRGACPGQLAFPWLAGMLGGNVRILPNTVVGEEMHFDWDRALSIRLDRSSPWHRKYMQYADALVELALRSDPPTSTPSCAATPTACSIWRTNRRRAPNCSPGSAKSSARRPMTSGGACRSTMAVTSTRSTRSGLRGASSACRKTRRRFTP